MGKNLLYGIKKVLEMDSSNGCITSDVLNATEVYTKKWLK